MSLNLSKELERFRHRLLDLTNRNPLLNFRKSKVRTLQVVDELPNKIFERLIDQNKKFRFLPMPEEEFRDKEQAEDEQVLSRSRFSLELPAHPERENEIAKRHRDNKLQTKFLDEKLDRVLNHITREARRSKEESGINYLYLALGFVEWRDKEGSKKPLSAPLMLIPIGIERAFDEKQGKYSFLATWTEEEIQFNISLAKRIENDFGLRIPKFKPEEQPEDYFARVAAAISTKSKWRVKRECVVGFFSFHKLLMYNDLEAWTKKRKFTKQSVVSQLVCGSDASIDVTYVDEYSIDDLAKNDDPVTLVLDADSSQHSALLDICHGKNLVIEGPPGTGKSQTITNAIAALIKQGKSVLFVAEKLAALNVVKSKLDDVGLGEFCLELHSDGATPRSVIRSLESRLRSSFNRPRRLKEIERTLENEKDAIRNYLAATNTPVGPGNCPLHETVWKIVDLRSRMIEPLFGYRGPVKIDQAQFKQNIETLDSLSQVLSGPHPPQESRWSSFAADRLRSNHIPRVTSLLSQMLRLAEDWNVDLDLLCEAFGGSREAWNQFIQPDSVQEIRKLQNEAPSAEIACENLLTEDTLQLFEQADSLIQQQQKAKDNLLKYVAITPDEHVVAERIRVALGPTLPNCADESIFKLKASQDSLPIALQRLVNLQKRHEDLCKLVHVTETPRSYGHVDHAFLSSLESLAASAPSSDLSIENFLDENTFDLAKEFCSERESLEKVKVILSEEGEELANDHQAAQFLKDVVQPLEEMYGDQTIRSLKQTKIWLDEVGDSLKSMIDLSFKLEAVGFYSVQNLDDFKEIESTLKIYEHPILKTTGPISVARFKALKVSVFKKAKSQARALENRENKLSELFEMSKVPTINELSDIQSVLQRSLTSPLFFVRPSFWLTWKKLVLFQHAQQVLNGGWRLAIERSLRHVAYLKEYLAAKQAYADSERLNKLFAGAFNGVGTDWKVTATLVQWVATLRNRNVHSSMHQKILNSCIHASELSRKSLAVKRRQFESYLEAERMQVVLGRCSKSTIYRQVRGEFVQFAPSKVEFTKLKEIVDNLVKNLSRLENSPDCLKIDDEMWLSDLISKSENVFNNQRRLQDLNAQQQALAASLEDSTKWQALGASYEGLDTNCCSLKASLSWVRRLKELSIVPNFFERRLLNERSYLIDDLSDCLSALHSLESQSDGMNFTAQNLGLAYSEESPKSLSSIKKLLQIGTEYGDCITRLLDICKAINFAPDDKLAACLSSVTELEREWTELKLNETNKPLHSSGDVDNQIVTVNALKHIVGDHKAAVANLARLLRERKELMLNLAKNIRDSLVRLGELESDWSTIHLTGKNSSSAVSRGVSKLADTVQSLLGVVNEHCDNIGNSLTICEESKFEVEKGLDELDGFIANSLSISQTKTELAGMSYSKLGSFLTLLEEGRTAALQSASWIKTLTSLGLPVASFESLVVNRFRNLEQIQDRAKSHLNRKKKYQELLGQLKELGDVKDGWLELHSHSDDVLKDHHCVLADLIKDTAGLEAWAAFCRVRSRCKKLDLEQFLNAALDGKIQNEFVAGSYELTLLEEAVGEVFVSEPSLSDFTRDAIEKRRENLKSFDRKILELNQSQIGHEASSVRLIQGNKRGKVAEKTELALIFHEIGKRTRHVQIRSLLERAGDSVRKLKPCFMMSPLSVSQFLDPNDFSFDVVVMDEASQIKPEDALGAILRAKQLVVVGDPKQLPPTSFFDRSPDEIDEEEETQFDDNESILEVAMKTFHPVRRLRWHYRSQHESLIQFSNDRFYEGDLVIFPSSSKDSGSLGIYHHYIEDGAFSKGLNHAEAEAVANAIAEHSRFCPSQSLGVGTFNMKQATLIQDKLDLICENDPRVRLALEKLERDTEKLFIKNLENLQGDERDVIFISYTYGPDPDTGRVYNRFGPLAGEGGWRRLNVMVSRARRRVEVFSSIRASDIKAGDEKSRGVNAFRDYLEFAESGSSIRLEKSLGNESTATKFEELIVRTVEDYGLKCRRRVGVAGFFVDIGVVSPYCDDTFLFGIVTDGETYRDAKSARDRDRLRDEVIKSRNWNIHRVWSADWFLNQQNEERRLIEKLDEVMSGIPKEFRKLQKTSKQDESRGRFEDLDVCDQIVAYLKEYGQGSRQQLASEIDQPVERVQRLLQDNLSPFVVTGEGERWKLKPGMIAEVNSVMQSNRKTIDEDLTSSSPTESPESEQESTEPSFSELIIQSSLYQSQKRNVTRIVVDDLVTTKILYALELRSWKSTVAALSDSVSIPPFRLRGMLPGIQRLLNIDGQQAMTICRESDTVELNETLIKQEFFTE